MICVILIIFVKKRGAGVLRNFLFHNSATTYFALAIKSFKLENKVKEKKTMRAKYKEEERSK